MCKGTSRGRRERKFKRARECIPARVNVPSSSCRSLPLSRRLRNFPSTHPPRPPPNSTSPPPRSRRKRPTSTPDTQLRCRRRRATKSAADTCYAFVDVDRRNLYRPRALRAAKCVRRVCVCCVDYGGGGRLRGVQPQRSRRQRLSLFRLRLVIYPGVQAKEFNSREGKEGTCKKKLRTSGPRTLANVCSNTPRANPSVYGPSRAPDTSIIGTVSHSRPWTMARAPP